MNRCFLLKLLLVITISCLKLLPLVDISIDPQSPWRNHQDFAGGEDASQVDSVYRNYLGLKSQLQLFVWIREGRANLQEQ